MSHDLRTWQTIYDRAVERKGGTAALNSLLPVVPSHSQLSSLGDDRVLAMMAKVVFRAGFVWRVIEQKWPGFEEAFFGFDPATLYYLPPEQWDAYARDTRIVRNMHKVHTVMENARFVLETSEKHGGFGRFLAEWPADDQLGLLQFLKKNGNRLGGMTGQWLLRQLQWDAWVLSRDVVCALQAAGLEVADNPTSLRDLRLIQQQFNIWQRETGLPYSHLSKILSYSVGENYPVDLIRQEMDKFGEELSPA